MNDQIENDDLNPNQREMSPEAKFIFDLINCVNQAYAAGLNARKEKALSRDE